MSTRIPDPPDGDDTAPGATTTPVTPTSATPTKYPKNMISAPAAPPPSAAKTSSVRSLGPSTAVAASAPM